MLPPPTIRDAIPSDSAAISSIFNHYVNLGIYTLVQDPYVPERLAEKIERLNDRECFLVAEQGAQILGWSSISIYSPRSGYRKTCLTSLFVAHDATGKGLGNQLYEQIFERCRQLDYHHIMVRILADNEGSIRFHERVGFEMVGIQKESGLIGNQFVDVAIMQKIV